MRKFEIIGFKITDILSRAFVMKPCSVFFKKHSDCVTYKTKMRVKYKRKYANKRINGVIFGKKVEIDFTTKKY